MTALERERRERAWTLCDDCEGECDDGDLLWPRTCPTCGGTGLVPCDESDRWEPPYDPAIDDDPGM